MIKNTFEQDANQPNEIKSEPEETARDSEFEKIADSHFPDAGETEDLLELPELTVAAPDYLEAPKIEYQKTRAGTSAEVETEQSNITNRDELLFQTVADPESIAETARKSGLAYAAAITLFGSIVFMLILGWLADLFLGTQPWGIVVGIVLGAAVGFFQFFRITSQIFKNKN